MAVTFLHSADWQLGMLRRFLGPEAQARFGQARIDAIERIGRVATETDAAFVVVSGDVFEANQVDRQIVRRAGEALRAITCPVFLLPGNHDSLEPGSVWTSPALTQALPSHVEVLTDARPRTPVPGVEVIGAPWRSRRPEDDPVGEPAAALPRQNDNLRVLVGHGRFDGLVPGVVDGELVDLDKVERAVKERRVDYVALGDRHSATPVGDTGRIWYAGTPEVTRPEEELPGQVLRVRLTEDSCDVQQIPIGTWRMHSHVVEVDDGEGLDALANWFGDQPDKARTYVRLGVRGSLSVTGMARLDMLVDAQDEVYAAVQRWPKRWYVTIRPDDLALDRLGVTGPSRAALDELRIATGNGDAEAADALALFHRLVGGVA